MTIDKAFNLSVYQYDYGVPVVFTAKKDNGFLDGDQIVFVFDSILDEKPFTVDGELYTFEFAFDENEAHKLYSNIVDKKKDTEIPYAIKHYREGEMVDTIKNAILYVRRTVPWQQN